MLGLKLPSDPRWANIAKNNLQEILTDHAYCEQKAANSAISLAISFPEKSELVSVMLDIAKEEISHFQMVHKLILEMGFPFGRERKDEYVIKLKSFFPKGGKRNDHLVNRLLYGALIEARSCERFKILSEELEGKKLRLFYKKLMISEANHYKIFLKLAHKYADFKEEVNQKWNSLLEHEKNLMRELKNNKSIHG